jgi:dipeptidyl aminopeptidase/acylaminoacyl peptidase
MGIRGRFGQELKVFVAVYAVAAAAGLAPARTAAQPAAAPVPARAFYGDPAVERAALSPSGRWLAMSTSRNTGRLGLAVFDLQEWKLHAQPALYADADIGEFHWLDDDRIVYTLTNRQRGSGEQRFWPGLFVVGRDGTEGRQLVKLHDPGISNERTVGREPLDYNHELLHVPARGDEVIVGEVRFDVNGEFQGYLAKRLDVTTGRTRNVSDGAPANGWRWLFDPDGEPRAIVTRSEGRARLLWRGPKDEAWKTLAEHDALRAPFRPRFVDRDGTLYVAVAAGRDGEDVLKRFDLAAGRPEDEPLVSTPGFDFWGHIVVETPGDRALGVRVTTDAESTVWFDPRLKALQKEADERLPGRINRLTCRRCGRDDMVTLVLSYNDRDPGVLWLHESATKRWRQVVTRRPDIDPRRMGSADMVRVRARDGLEIPVWVTLPPGGASGSRPAVVLVHGGPWTRGRHWAWNADAQFLASRGYVVIQPEFRGSTGYGDKLFRAGWRQWGQAMQDDLVDALQWAVGKGLVDAKRVCIAGASYGGYATLMGLARHGEHFRCGVAWIGVTDPRLMFEWRRDYDVGSEGRQYTYPTLIGDPVSDKAMLDANTPVLLADRIRAPLLLAYGSNDRRVPLVHGTRMRDALAAAGRPPEWVVYDGEGHGWNKLETQLDFAKRLEDFLAKHLAAK